MGSCRKKTKYFIDIVVLSLVLGLVYVVVSAQAPKAISVKNGQNTILKQASDLIKAGRLAEAESVLRTYLGKFPADLEAKTILGVALDQLGRADEAKAAYLEVLAKNPRQAAALSNLGILLAKGGDLKSAITHFTNALRYDPRNVQAMYNLAAIYSEKGEAAKAIPYLEKLSGVTIKDRIPKTRDTSLVFLLFKSYLATGKLADSARIADYLEKSAPSDARVLFTIGLMYASADRYTEAIARFERVKNLVPGNFDVLYNLGIAYYNLNDLDRGRSVLQEALEINPGSPEAFYRLGLIAQAKGETENALGLWLKAIELRSEFHEPAFLIAEELSKRQAYTGASGYYEKAAALKGDNLLYKIRLVVNYIRLQQYDKARRVLDPEQAKRPDDLSLAYLRGYLARAEGTYDEAIAAFEKVLKLSPNNPDALANLGFLAYERAENEKAETLLRQAISLNPKGYAAYYDYGRLLIRLKRFSDAIVTLEKGAALSKTDPGVRYQLFIAYSRLKQKEKADSAFAEFKRLEKAVSRPGGSASSGDRAQDVPDTLGNKKP